jgi:hypothetical protein
MGVDHQQQKICRPKKMFIVEFLSNISCVHHQLQTLNEKLNFNSFFYEKNCILNFKFDRKNLVIYM